jgi:hypothetical protein
MGRVAKLFKAMAATKSRSAESLLVRFQLLKRIAGVILPEYRFKWPQMAWWQNEAFTAYLERFDERDGNNADRRWMVSQLLRLVAAVPGDTAEVGCYRGAMSWLICEANQHVASRHPRVHHLFDSFEGLSQPGSNDGTHWQAGSLACGESLVKLNLSPFEGHFYTYQGWVPERFDEVADRSFAFVHIDVDLYEPTLQSLDFFYPRLNPGGILICDDYGFDSCPGAILACDRFFEDKAESMIQFADGGGFLIKGVATADEYFSAHRATS